MELVIVDDTKYTTKSDGTVCRKKGCHGMYYKIFTRANNEYIDFIVGKLLNDDVVYIPRCADKPIDNRTKNFIPLERKKIFYVSEYYQYHKKDEVKKPILVLTDNTFKALDGIIDSYNLRNKVGFQAVDDSYITSGQQLLEKGVPPINKSTKLSIDSAETINFGTSILLGNYDTNIQSSSVYSHRFIERIMNLRMYTEFGEYDNATRRRFDWFSVVNNFCLNQIERYLLLKVILKNHPVKVKDIFPKTFLESMKVYYEKMTELGAIKPSRNTSTKRSIFDGSNYTRCQTPAITYIYFLEALENNFKNIMSEEHKNWLEAFKILSVYNSHDVYIILKNYMFQADDSNSIIGSVDQSVMKINLQKAFEYIDSLNLFKSKVVEYDNEDYDSYYCETIPAECYDASGYLELKSEFDFSFLKQFLDESNQVLYRKAKKDGLLESYIFPLFSYIDYINFRRFFTEIFKKDKANIFYKFLHDYANSNYIDRAVITAFLKAENFSYDVGRYQKINIVESIGRKILVDKYHFMEDFEYELGIGPYSNPEYFKDMTIPKNFMQNSGFYVDGYECLQFPTRTVNPNAALMLISETQKDKFSSIYQMFITAASKDEKSFKSAVNLTKQFIAKKLKYSKTHDMPLNGGYYRNTYTLDLHILSDDDSRRRIHVKYYIAICNFLFKIQEHQNHSVNDSILSQDELELFDKAESTIYKILVESLVNDVNISIANFDIIMSELGKSVYRSETLTKLMEIANIPQKYKTLIFKAYINSGC